MKTIPWKELCPSELSTSRHGESMCIVPANSFFEYTGKDKQFELFQGYYPELAKKDAGLKYEYQIPQTSKDAMRLVLKLCDQSLLVDALCIHHQEQTSKTATKTGRTIFQHGPYVRSLRPRQGSPSRSWSWRRSSSCSIQLSGTYTTS